MQYKSIVLNLLEEQYPALYENLRKQRLLLKTLDLCAADLKTRHYYWIDRISVKRPESDPAMITSEALELAIQDLRESLPSESAASGDPSEPLTLDAAMAFVRLHTPSA